MMTGFEVLGLIVLYAVIFFGFGGYCYILVWREIDWEIGGFANLFKLVSNIKNRHIRLIARVLAVITWPIWSFVQIMAGVIAVLRRDLIG